MLAPFDPERAIDRFLAQRAEGVFCPTEWIDALSIDQSYEVLLGLLDRHLAAGGAQAGWKVGLTARPPIQEQFRTHEPAFGFLSGDAPQPNGARLDHAALVRPGFENELCLEIGDALWGPGVDAARARACITAVRPAFEIIETRGEVIGHLEANIPDNLQQKHIVTGDPVPFTAGIDLAAVTVRVAINGERVAEAPGSNVLGDPVNALVWLANRLGRFGRCVEAGQLVMTGPFTRQFPLRRGDRIAAAFDPIGEVSAEAV